VNTLIQLLFRLFGFRRKIPGELAPIFFHYFLDISWFGILNGSVLSFIGVYVTRLGGSAYHVGLISAAPALVNLALTLPAGWILHRTGSNKYVILGALFQRAFYLFLPLLPFVFPDNEQVWVIVMIIFIMSVPGTIMMVGFNGMFAGTVPEEWRGLVVGIRNALLALFSMVSTLAAGWILDGFVFPIGYQLVFGIGFIGAMMSVYQLWRVYQLQKTVVEIPENVDVSSSAVLPGRQGSAATRISQILRGDILKTRFGLTLVFMFLFHLTQTLPLPLFPVFFVRNLNLSNQVIAIGSAIFNLVVFISSSQLGHWLARWGNQKVTVLGCVLFGLYPILLTLSTDLLRFSILHVIGGFAWGIIGGASFNFLLSGIPQSGRAPYLAWYNFAMHAAILIGSLAGPVIASFVGYVPALIIFGLSRSAVGLLIRKYN
jgi:MFS family permease